MCLFYCQAKRDLADLKIKMSLPDENVKRLALLRQLLDDLQYRYDTLKVKCHAVRPDVAYWRNKYENAFQQAVDECRKALEEAEKHPYSPLETFNRMYPRRNNE